MTLCSECASGHPDRRKSGTRKRISIPLSWESRLQGGCWTSMSCDQSGLLQFNLDHCRGGSEGGSPRSGSPPPPVARPMPHAAPATTVACQAASCLLLAPADTSTSAPGVVHSMQSTLTCSKLTSTNSAASVTTVMAPAVHLSSCCAVHGAEGWLQREWHAMQVHVPLQHAAHRCLVIGRAADELCCAIALSSMPNHLSNALNFGSIQWTISESDAYSK